MGHTATKGNSLVGHKPQIKFPVRYHGPVGAVTVTETIAITDAKPEIGSDYSRGSNPRKGSYSVGQTLLGLHLTNGVSFRKISATREELKVSGGKLVLRKVTRKDVSYWTGEYYAAGERAALVLVPPVMIVKGDPSPKADVRDLLISRAVLANKSIY